MAAEFEVGYAPAYPDFLLKRLVKALSAELLVEAGLAISDQEGNVRDRFRRRITFPVHDLSGKAVGIGARILPGDREDGPKYLNSPETPVYRKAEVLYNLQRAKASATKLGELFLVEGYTDVIAMVRAGVTNTVATCGTALGEGTSGSRRGSRSGWCSRSTRTTRAPAPPNAPSSSSSGSRSSRWS